MSEVYLHAISKFSQVSFRAKTPKKSLCGFSDTRLNEEMKSAAGVKEGGI